MMIVRRVGLLFLAFFIVSGLFLFPLHSEETAQKAIPPKILTLNEALEIAIKNHPSLMAAKSAIDVSNAIVKQSQSAYFPQVSINNKYQRSLSGGQSQTSQGSTGGGSLPPTTSRSSTPSDFYSFGIALTQTLYDFGKTQGAVKASKENLTNSSENYKVSLQDVVLNLKRAYYSYLKAQRLVKVAEDEVTQMERHLTQAQGFYKVGTRPKIDVTTAEVNLANAKLDLVTVQNNVKIGKITLENAMGVRNLPAFGLEDILDYKKAVFDPEDSLKKAITLRPEILGIKAKERASEGDLAIARSGFFPLFAFGAGYGKSGQNFPLDKNWNLGVSMSLPIFSGFATTAQVAQAKANFAELLANEDKARQDIILEVNSSFLGIQEAEEKLLTTEKNVAQAKENQDLAEGRYKVGVGSPLEFSDAQLLLTRARTDHIQALYDYKVAVATMEKAVGLLP